MSRSASKAGRAGAFSVGHEKPLALTLRRIRQQRDQVVIPIGATLRIIAETLERQLSNSPALLPAQLVLGRRPQKLQIVSRFLQRRVELKRLPIVSDGFFFIAHPLVGPA